MKKLLIAALAAMPMMAFANIDSIDAILYGDPRAGNPTGMELGVSGVQVGANESQFAFTVDFTAAHEVLHGTDTKLLEFYFNVNPNDNTAWTVSDVTAGYTVISPATVQGGGSPTGFLFELDQQPPNSTGVPLEFILTLNGGGVISAENFSLAPDWEGAPELLEAQIGAHVGNLTVNSITCPQGGCSDSGFLTADWPEGGPDPQQIDAPANLALLALGLVGLATQRRLGRR